MNEETKKEFSRLFNWYITEQENGYSSRKEILKTPTEAEIYAEIGRLLCIKGLFERTERSNFLEEYKSSGSTNGTPTIGDGNILL